MEFFNRAKTVRLKSHHTKYLIADEDEQSVRQSRRSAAARAARWAVEFVEGNPHIIRLKGCHGGYLTASDEPFLLTGKKVLQTVPENRKDPAVEWEPIKEGEKVKLRTRAGKFLRANGAAPPWRNSVTHDVPHRTATQDWVLWEVETAEISVEEEFDEDLQSESPSSTISSFSNDFSDSKGRALTERTFNFSDSNVRAGSSPSSSSRSSFSFSSPRWPSMLSRSNNASIMITSGRREDGMEFFQNAKAVRLQSHLGKYLVADEDEESVRQSRNGSSRKARWTVEFVDGKSNAIRLKSCHGLYLTAAKESFLLGATGKKVLQTLPAKSESAGNTEWEPLKEGQNVKLMSGDGKFLRANWGPPPYRNSVTCDIPHRTKTQDWVLWGVDVVDITLSGLSDTESVSTGSMSMLSRSSLSSVRDDYLHSPETGSPEDFVSGRRMGSLDSEQGDSGIVAVNTQSPGMEFFKRAKTVRLRSHHHKYLTADADEEHVEQDRSGTSKQARWTVEYVSGAENIIRLKSCFGKYLTASDEHFLLGVTGEKVFQTLPKKLDSKVEWEPVREGFQVKLKTRYGNFLRANGGLPPWRNSITHDIPHRHLGWILWEVDIMEIRADPPPPKPIARSESLDDDLSSPSFHLITQPSSSGTDQGNESLGGSPAKYEGRMIHYHVADDDGKVNDAIEGHTFRFKGTNVKELTEKLEEETELEKITVCSKNKINGKLYPLRLGLPPNNDAMHIVVVPSTCKVAFT